MSDSNSITGTLPSEIGQVTKLTGLFMGMETVNSLFQGPLPTEIGRLTNLKDLHLRKYQSPAIF